MRLVRPDGDTRESNHSFHRVQALSAFYISRVIDYAKCAYRVEHSQKAEWSANVGVPVSHFDSPHVDVFRRVCAVAWCWADQDIIPSSVSDAMYQYAESLREVSIESSDCHAVPELAGAILSFVTGRGAQPGPYIYFDVEVEPLMALRFASTIHRVNARSHVILAQSRTWASTS